MEIRRRFFCARSRADRAAAGDKGEASHFAPAPAQSSSARGLLRFGKDAAAACAVGHRISDPSG